MSSLYRGGGIALSGSAGIGGVSYGVGRTTVGTGNYGVDYSKSSIIKELLSRRDGEVAKKYDFIRDSYWGKTVGEILQEQKFERLVKVKATVGDTESFPVEAYSQFYTIYKDKDFLSIPGLKERNENTASGGVVNVDEAFMEKWCNDQWDSRDLTSLHKAAKWCTKRKALSNATGNNNKNKEYTSHFSKKDYEDLLKEKSLSKEERLWLKNFTDVADSSSGNEIGKMVDWCSCVTVFVFVDEQDTDEYKRALKYCIKREFQSEVKAVTS